MATVDAFVEKGFPTLGYNYFNLDDCWAKDRHPNGTLQADPKSVTWCFVLGYALGLWLCLQCQTPHRMSRGSCIDRHFGVPHVRVANVPLWVAAHLPFAKTVPEPKILWRF
jgi:hypothetical protein